jgi:hypothetical protein
MSVTELGKTSMATMQKLSAYWGAGDLLAKLLRLR